MKNMILSKCLFDYAEHFLPWQTLHKNQVKVPRKGIKSANYCKRQNDDYKWCHVKDGISYEEEVFSKCSSDHA